VTTHDLCFAIDGDVPLSSAAAGFINPLTAIAMTKI